MKTFSVQFFLRLSNYLALFLVGLLFAKKQASAQSLELTYAELTDNKVVIHYDLVDSVIGRSFIIRLYSSKDNFFNPLENLSGDFGLNVKPGIGKKVALDVKKEFGDSFQGGLSFEIRARIFIPFINLDQLSHYKVFRRKHKYALTWSGGRPENILNFDLYKGERKAHTYPNIANVGHQHFEFPAHIKPGKNYRFVVADTKNKDERVDSEPFRIRRRVPLAFKAVSTAGIVAGLWFLLQQPQAEAPIGPPPLSPTR